MALSRKDILNDPDIKSIPIENIGPIDYDNVKILDIGNSKSSKMKGYAGSVVLFVAICLIAFSAIFVCMNYKFVVGDVIGGDFKIGEVSIVSNSYNPVPYIKEGVVVYYDGPKSNLISTKDSYQSGIVTKANDNKYYVSEGKDYKDKLIKAEEVQYVCKSTGDTQKPEEQ